MKTPRAIEKVLSSQKLFLSVIGAVALSWLYLRLDGDIMMLMDDGNRIVDERTTLFYTFGQLFVAIILTFTAGNVVQKFTSNKPISRDRNREDYDIPKGELDYDED